MARERRRKPIEGTDRRRHERDPRSIQPECKVVKGKVDITHICLALAAICCVVGFSVYFYNLYMQWWLSRRVITPHPSPRILNSNSSSPTVTPEKFWGSYRPQVYFGMKTRSPKSLVTGLMWMQQTELDVHLRHTCEQSDGLPSYGWLMHDGLNFGVQEIRDFGFLLKTEFAKRIGGQHGGDWSWRITGRAENAEHQASLISLLFYVATDGQGMLQPHLEGGTRLAFLTGSTEELGHFQITFQKPWVGENKGPKYASFNHLKAVSPGLHRLTDVVKSSLSNHFIHSPPGGKKKHYFAVDTYQPAPESPGSTPPSENCQVLVHQVTLQLPFQIEVVFESGSFMDRPNQLSGEVLSAVLAQHQTAFEDKFSSIFQLRKKGFSPLQEQFAMAALSNMIGGMGYFYGHSIVQSKYNDQPVLYPEGPLFTAVPARSFFPRGFLWDEGFHQLLVSQWDTAMSQEVIASWLDLMNVEGWIPREQILDNEARSKVPSEFILQRNENANPPTLFLVLEKLIRGLEVASLVQKDELYLRKLLPRLRSWYDWYNTTQAGPLPYTFRWRGRDEDTNMYLNPKTLTSGLDDYPRASHPSSDERHVDLRCWMALASGVMADVCTLLGEPAEEYQRMQQVLSNNVLLEEQHWSEQLNAFADYGNHTQSVVLEREKIYIPPGQPRHHYPSPRLVRAIRKPPKLQYVGALGYVSLFPFLLRVLQPDSPRLETLFRDMRNEKKLWTPYGLRSLSKTSPLYLKYNTEHDGPYWRGPIWININYLAVKALHHYSSTEGPFRQQATDLYQQLRSNLITNIYHQYLETGYIWEQYNDSTGKGQGSYPFTGWSSLVVLMMAEEY
ncbi:mannosyl-oligosaccharide glucosidase isoform X1 [Microcaecilia unicolor]|uniref:Mannosyl-oligosaccharide glucosidase n=2 Tax=Microcaecilia unicolor TaxID=1415580 RepID=A0A6P7X859_9AMPH|nr:mannosyl-oligosaccharide glucosidase isoform X1 [Microcaecilia unicolor]